MKNYEEVLNSLFDVIEPALKSAGFEVVDGYDNQIIIRAKDCPADVLLTLTEAE